MSLSSEFAYEQVCSMIYRGRLKPGDRLVETELAARLGLSHIPVRESLVRLTSEGLVRRVRNWATFVENFAADDALEIYAMRLALEPLATRMAAIRGGPRVAKRLQRLFDRMTIYREKQDHEKLDLADYRFHLTIVQASEVKRLIRAYEGCHIRCLSYLRGNNGEVNAYVREHQQIIKEIGAQRPDAAERVASDHVRGAMQRIEAALGTRFEDRPRS